MNKFSLNAKQYIKNNYSWEKTFENYIKLIKFKKINKKQDRKYKIIILLFLLFIFSFLYIQYKKITIPFSLVEVNTIKYNDYSYEKSKDFFDIKLKKEDELIVSNYIKNNFKYVENNDIDNIRSIVKLTRSLLKHDTDNYTKVHDFYSISDVINDKDDFSAICS
jgi:hypothetical protein